MTDNAEFLNSLKIGSKVAVHEGYTEDNALTEVTSITTKYIQVMRYPSLKFDRQTGEQIPHKKGSRTYRYLFSPVVWQAEANHERYKEQLFDLLRESTITADKFNKCYSALEEILNG